MVQSHSVGARGLLAGSSMLAILLLSAQPAWGQSSDFEKQQSADAPDNSNGDDGNEIVVTGTSIRGTPPTGSNLISITGKEVKETGATNTADLLATVPQLSSFNTAPRQSGNGFGSFAPAMRGLPSSATLVLMNGHRLVGAAATETNSNFPAIPALAIERVEIVADGASAIYGSDAIAGVVNFITRKSFSGAEASLRYGVADDYYSLTGGLMVGHEWDGGSVVAAYQFSENDNIVGRDRDWRVLDFRPFGGIDTRSINCPVPNVRIPQTGAVTYAAPALLPNTTNFCDSGEGADLFPRSRTHNVYLTARQDMSDSVALWGEVVWSKRLDRIQMPVPVQAVTLLNTNPFFIAPPGTTPSQETVLFRPDNLFGADRVVNVVRTKVGNSSAGIDVRLFDDFQLTIYGTYDWSDNLGFQPGINPSALAAAAAGTTVDTALDPFGTETNPVVAAAITDFPFLTDNPQHVILGAAKIDGPLMTLPGGDLRIGAGVEWRKEKFKSDSLAGTLEAHENLDRTVKSAFGEVFIPLFGPDNATTLLRRLDISLSARHDKYSDFGSTTNPKVGVNWAPADGLTFRGSYGKSFRAPGLRNVGGVPVYFFFPAPVAGIVVPDPTRGAAQVNTVVLQGGNPEIQPERAETFSFGADFAPMFVPGLQASVTYYDIHFTDVIGTPPLGARIFVDPTFTSRIIRDPSLALLDSLIGNAVPFNVPTPLPAVGNILDIRDANFGSRDTNGIDFDVRYRHSTSFGSINVGLAGNHILNFDTQFSEGSPVADTLRLGLPETTIRATLGFTAGPLNVVSFANCRSGVINQFSTPTGTSEFRSDSYTTIDLRLSLTLPDVGAIKDSEVALQINDLFDEDPPFFPAADGVASPFNPIGRFVALDVRTRF